MTDRNVSIRIGVTGREEVKRAFDEVGRAGQDAFNKTASAADASGAAIDRETARLNRLAQAARQAASANDNQARFSAFMGVGPSGAGSARDSASVFIAAAKAQEEMEARTKALRAQIDPLGAAQAKLNTQIAEANALFRAGAITAAEQAAAHRLAQAGFDTTAKSLGAVGGATRLAGYELTNLGYQLNDVMVGLASGQRPFTVLMQQGTQIGQIFASSGVGVGGVLRSLGGVIAGLLTPATILAGSLAAIGGAAIYAYDSYLTSQKELEVATVGLGRAAGATVAQLNEIARAAADAGDVSVASARDMELAFLRAGNIGSDQFGRLIAIARDYAATTGQELPDAAKELAQSFADPARGVDLLNARVGGFDDKTRELIRTLSQQNDMTRAQTVLLDALRPSLLDAADATTALGRAWDYVARNASDAFDAMGEAISGGVDPTLQDRLGKLLKERQTAATTGGTWASGLGGMVGFAPSRSVAEIDAEISSVRRVIGMAELAAARARADADATRASTQAGSLARGLVPGASDLQRLKEQHALLASVLDSPLAAGKVADLKQVQTAYDAVTRAIESYLDPAEKARRLDQLEIDALKAKTPAQRAAIAEERRRIELAGQVVTAATAEADITRKGAIAHAQAQDALDRHNASLVRQKTVQRDVYEEVRKNIVAQGDQIELTKKQIALVGTNQSLGAIEIAQLQAKHDLLQQNIDLGSAEAQTYIANAARIEALNQQLQLAQSSMQELESLFDMGTQQFADLIAEGKYDWKSWSDAGRSAILDINKELIKLALLNPLKNLLFGQNNATFSSVGGLFGSLFGGTSASIYHAGGMAGEAASTRMLPMAMFRSAPRFHDGAFLSPDEVPAVLQRGERVLNRAETLAYNRGRSGGGAIVNVTIQTPSPAAFQASRTQMAADLSRAVEMGMRGR